MEGKDDKERAAREEYSAVFRRMYELLNRDPLEAVRAADALTPSCLLDSDNVESIRSSIFVDAGTALRDPRLVRRATTAFGRFVAAEPDSKPAHYNLANALAVLADLLGAEGDGDELRTSGLRRAARRHFELASTEQLSQLSGRARTNKGNLLRQSGRWIEAYDCYQEALRDDLSNGVAALCLAQLLVRGIRSTAVPADLSTGLAAFYLREALSREEETCRIGGPRAVELGKRLLASLGHPESREPLRDGRLDRHVRFFVDHRLLLSVDIACCEVPGQRCDDLTIPSLVEPIDTPYGVPPAFAMFNQLVADYCAARWLFYDAEAGDVLDTGLYMDTLDYAKYGVRSSLLLLSQRSAIDVLDRVAVAASHHFGLPGKPSAISFLSRWHVYRQKQLAAPLRWQREVEQEILLGNRGLAALADLALDLRNGGEFAEKRSLRNESTHRFVVLHDMGSSPSRDSEYITHYNESDAREATLTSLRVARAAIFYLRDAMICDAARKAGASSGRLGELQVYPHHFIRGDDGAAT